MATLKLSQLLFLLFTTVLTVTCQAQNPDNHREEISKDPKSVEEWFKNLPNAKEKITKLHFYFHDIVSGKNRTVVTVARSNLTAGFGTVRVMDDALREGPEPDSKVVGRAQGIYVAAALEVPGLLMTLNHVFTEGPWKGTTLSLLGHNPILEKYREIPVVGGSGGFRLARGVATARTVWFNMTSEDAVVEYDVFVLHY